MGIIENAKKLVAVKEIKILFPEANDPRILEASIKIQNEKIAKPILLGNSKEIKSFAKKSNLDISNLEIIEHKNSEDLSKRLFELRKEKGMTEKEAKEQLKVPMYYALMLLDNGTVDAIISGATTPTSETIRPALQIIGTKKGVSIASSYFIMQLKDFSYIFADCAFNVNPSKDELAAIAISTADSAKLLGIKPKVAMLSFSTKGSGKHETVDKVVQATEIVRKIRPDIVVEGEIQVDAAIVPEIAFRKNPNGSISGDANVLIFPDLNSGNIAYKLVQRLAGFKAIGPIIQGLKKPVNDLSRGCSVQDIVDLAVLTALQALGDLD
jgi:phosphate acetyltransferase